MKPNIYIFIIITAAATILAATISYALYSIPLDKTMQNEDSKPDKILVLHNWQEYIDPGIIKEFETVTGIKLQVEGYDVVQQAVANLQSNPGNYDLLIIDGVNMANLVDYKLIEKIDYTNLPGYKNIDTEYLEFQSEKIRPYSIPYLLSLTGLAYNKKYINDKPTSWSALWDSRYHGRTALLGDQFYGVFPIKAYLEKMGITGIDKNYENFQDIAYKMKTNDLKINETFATIEKLNQGELWLAECYNGDLIYKGSADLEFVIPEEGALLSSDFIAINKDSKHKDWAYQFLNFLLRPEIMAKNASYLGYMPPSSQAKDFTPPEIRNNPLIFPDLTATDKYQALDYEVAQFSYYQKLFQYLQSDVTF